MLPRIALAVTSSSPPPAIESEAARRDRLTRRLGSWLASEPAPADIVDAVYQVAQRLEATLPGGLRIVPADVYLDILCRSLLYCDAADLLAVWPRLRPRPEM